MKNDGDDDWKTVNRKGRTSKKSSQLRDQNNNSTHLLVNNSNDTAVLTDKKDNNEWSVVTKKRPHKNLSKRGTFQHHHSPSENSSLLSSPVDSEGVSRAHSRINNCLKQMRSTNFTSQARTTITSSVPALLDPLQQPNRIVIAGLGNLDDATNRDAWNAAWQLAALLELLHAFVAESNEADDDGEEGGCMALVSTLPMCAQDPAFTETDVRILADLGISVLPVPDAVELVDDRTLLFVPFVDAVVLLPEILNGKDPSVYVGSDIEEVVEKLSEEGYAER
jgi:hypothetical protein